MRKVVDAAVRSVAALSIAMTLTISVEAKPRESRWLERRVDPIVKVWKFVVRSLGDGLGDPWPKP